MGFEENFDGESEGKMADAIYVIRSTQILRRQVGRLIDGQSTIRYYSEFV
jgi:hypothetical protein